MELTLQISSSLTVEQAWARLTNWRAHAQWVPLTKMIILREGSAPGLGDEFIGRTGLGRLAFDDHMTVTRFEAPQGPAAFGFCEVTKTGHLLKGSASFKIDPTDAGCTVEWVENIQIPQPIELLLSPVLTLIGAAVFKFALKKALAR